MKKDYKIFASFWFLGGLAILILNDLVFKGLYENWLTGKLSDFAGLFIFPLFWTALFPKHKAKIFWLTGLLFIYWKSSYSQSLIDAWNSLQFISFSRVVDYTDLVALSALALAYWIDDKKDQLKSININPILPILLSTFSFFATSYYTDIEVEKEFSFSYPKDTLEKKIYYLSSIKNPYTEDYIPDSSGRFKIHEYNHLDTIYSDQELIGAFIKDTMNLFIYEDFCHNGYEASIVLSGDNKESKLELKGFHYPCPRDGKHYRSNTKKRDDLKILIKSFNKRVINELNK